MTPTTPSPPPLGVADALSREAIEHWLRETDETRLEALWAAADETRHRYVGDAVHLRGLVELSNYCVRGCTYCGIRAGNRGVERYRVSAEVALECARKAVEFGYGTLVMQSGEDYGITTEWMAGRAAPHPLRDGDLRHHPESRRAPRRGPHRLARGGRRPLPPALRDLRRGPVPAHPPRPSRQGERPHAHPAPPAGARLRGRYGDHGRHPRADAREHRRRHRAVPRHGHGHDRRRSRTCPTPRRRWGRSSNGGSRTATGRRTRRRTASS